MSRIIDEMDETRKGLQAIILDKSKGRVRPHSNKFKKLREAVKHLCAISHPSENPIPLETVYNKLEKTKYYQGYKLDEVNKTVTTDMVPYKVYKFMLGDCFRKVYKMLKRSV